MSRMIFAAVICIASCVIVESLVCNKCLIAIGNKCVVGSTETCSTNSSLCATRQFSFTIAGTTGGIKSLGCLASTACNTTVNGTTFGVATVTTSSCCSTDKCNLVQNGAPLTKMTLTATVSAALLACLWGSL